MEIKLKLPASLKRSVQGRIPADGLLYMVGGAVRDLHMDAALKDLDLVCRGAKKFAQACAEQMNASLVMMEKKADEPCYRIVDRRSPDEVIDIAEMRGDAIEADLSRRDFTINAMAVRLRNDGCTGELIDPYRGCVDIQQRTIRMVSREAFISDPLRIVRAFRFAAVLAFAIDSATVSAMKHNASLLRQVSVERIMAELKHILLTSKSAAYFKQMDDLGILEHIFPEILPMKGCMQNWYHHKDVWEHSLLVLEQIEQLISDLSRFGEAGSRIEALIDDDKKVFLKIAGLLHDIGKPSTRGMKPGTERIIFYDHDKAGAEIIKGMAVRLKLSCRLTDFLIRIVAEHLRPLVLSSPKAKPAAHLRWFRKMRDDAVPALILSMADVMSSLGPESGEEYREHFVDWAAKSIRKYFDSIKPQLEAPLLINGHDLISLGVKPGIALGKLLYHLRSAQDRGRITSREEALNLAGEMITRLSSGAGVTD